MLRFISLRWLLFLTLYHLVQVTACTLPEKKTPEKQSKEDRMDLAMLQEFEMTQDPALGYVPKERLLVAQEYRSRLLARNARTDAIAFHCIVVKPPFACAGIHYGRVNRILCKGTNCQATHPFCYRRPCRKRFKIGSLPYAAADTGCKYRVSGNIPPVDKKSTDTAGYIVGSSFLP